jgi:hypothetical protein
MLKTQIIPAILAAVLLATGAASCSTHEETALPLYGLELEESYGVRGDRKVTVKLDLTPGPDGALNMDRVSIRVEPEPAHSLAKLESQLSEGSLRTHPGSAWPEPVLRPVPQLVPVLRRVQTAMAVLYPGDRTIERAIVRVFEKPPTIGFTRLEMKGEQVSISTVVLAAVDAKTRMAIASVRGTRSEDGFTLDGKRWILGEPVVPMHIAGRRHRAQRATPQENTLEH